MNNSLKDKVIIVTGGAGLLGKTFVKAIVENSGLGIIADINENSGKQVLSEIKTELKSKNVDYVKLDITSIRSISRVIEYITDKYGKIDALVNNAYPRNKNYGKKFEEVAYKDFCENIDMHLGGYFLITQQVAKIMMKQKYGNIISMSSIYGFTAPRFEIYQGTNMTMPVEYAAIKAAIINLTRYLASYLGPYNIRVNCVSPGGVFDNQPKEFLEKYSQKVLLGKRMAVADDLTGTLNFLLSDSSSYINGQNIVIDGGWTINK